MARIQVPEGKVLVVNHKKSEVHVHPVSKVKEADGGPRTGMEKHFTFYPGSNFVDEEVWEKFKEINSVIAFIADDILEENGIVSKDEVPTLKEYVEAGYNPGEYRSRFPVNAKKVDDLDIAEAQKVYDEEHAKTERDRRAGR